jgi:hypothetical protein
VSLGVEGTRQFADQLYQDALLSLEVSAHLPTGCATWLDTL